MDSLELLTTLIKRKKDADAQIKMLIPLLHEAGYSYDQIGEAMNVSRQRAAVIGRANGATVRIRKPTIQYKKKEEA